MRPHAVYACGVVASSTLFSLQGGFPSPEGYADFHDVQPMAGGEASNSSIVLSRLGLPVTLDGNWLGDDESSQCDCNFAG